MATVCYQFLCLCTLIHVRFVQIIFFIPTKCAMHKRIIKNCNYVYEHLLSFSMRWQSFRSFLFTSKKCKKNTEANISFSLLVKSNMTTVDTKWPLVSTQLIRSVYNLLHSIIYFSAFLNIMHFTNKTRHTFLTIYVYVDAFINGLQLQLTFSIFFYKLLVTRTQLCLNCNHLYGMMNRTTFFDFIEDIFVLILSITQSFFSVWCKIDSSQDKMID